MSAATVLPGLLQEPTVLAPCPLCPTRAETVEFKDMQNSSDLSLSSYMDGLYRYAIVLTRNPATASDLVQETYVRALGAQDRLWIGSNVKSWLFTILRNLRINQLRRQRAAPLMVELDGDGQSAAAVETKNPHEVYVSKLECLSVRAAIQQLPLDFREIIVLREYEEMSYQDIATLLDCPVGTVMSRLARARAKLRELLHRGAKQEEKARSQSESL